MSMLLTGVGVPNGGAAPPDDFYYLQPGGVFLYRQPGGVDLYIQP